MQRKCSDCFPKNRKLDRQQGCRDAAALFYFSVSIAAGGELVCFAINDGQFTALWSSDRSNRARIQGARYDFGRFLIKNDLCVRENRSRRHDFLP